MKGLGLILEALPAYLDILPLQLLINGVGFLVLFWLGWVLERGRPAPRPKGHVSHGG